MSRHYHLRARTGTPLWASRSTFPSYLNRRTNGSSTCPQTLLCPQISLIHPHRLIRIYLHQPQTLLAAAFSSIPLRVRIYCPGVIYLHYLETCLGHRTPSLHSMQPHPTCGHLPTHFLMWIILGYPKICIFPQNDESVF